tara:strand:+ start:5662 stop:5847 length:186 start_codon:yes stop_codon:yes gene_type:complete
MSVKKIVDELEKDHDNISYVYIKNGKEYFTPNMRVAIKRNESNILTVIDNGKIIKEITILN